MTTQQAPSPFLPGTHKQFAWDSTSLGYIKSCPRKYYYTMIEGWRATGASVHLDFGGWYASALEHYYKHLANGMAPDDALDEIVLEALINSWEHDRDEEGERIPGTGQAWESHHNAKTRETLIRSIVWYIDQFGENDSMSTVILANGKPAVELSFKMDIGDGLLLCGHLDRVVEYGGVEYVTDQKTTGSTLSSYYFDQYNPHNQMTLYSLAAKVVFGMPVKGVVIDAAQIAVGFTRFERGFTFRTDSQLEEFLGNARWWISVAHRCADEGNWPMNESSCGDYGGCPFRDICSKAPEMRERFLESNFTRRHWNPLQER